MQLSHRFKEIDKHRVWEDHKFCVLCGSNRGCSLHHVMSCKRDIDSSILNSSMLCDRHHREADGHNVSDAEYQSNLLQITIRIVLRSGYTLTKKDIEFFTHHKNLYV
jgi:hypothetical protein